MQKAKVFHLHCGMLPRGYPSSDSSADSSFYSTTNNQGCLTQCTVQYGVGTAGSVVTGTRA